MSLPETPTRVVLFLSTLSLRRATGPGPAWLASSFDFYPRSPCGERPKKSPLMCFIRHFYPRSPCGERRRMPLIKFYPGIFLSTLSLRRATETTPYRVVETQFLSTLSLRRATRRFRTVNNAKIFLSTLSLRRATQQPAGDRQRT